MKQPPKLDFDALVSRMKEAGAFDDYPKPLGSSDASLLGPNFRNPRFPGERAFILGANPVKEGVNIPQDIITANEKSFSDALKLYMPVAATTESMHEYFAAEQNFMHSRSFRSFVSNLSHTISSSRLVLDSGHTMQLDSKQRRRDDSRIFTAEELMVARNVSEKVPALPMAIAAYQASMADYLEKLDKAVDSSTALNKLQKKRGHEVIDTLKVGFNATGIVQHLLPAVAIHYHKNHAPNIGEDVTEKDFREGIGFMMRNGAFHKNVMYADGTATVHFSCPAQPFIGKTTATDLDGNTSGEQVPVSAMFGKALYHIYREADARMKESPQAFKQISRDMGHVLDSVLTVSNQGSTATGGLLGTLRRWLR